MTTRHCFALDLKDDPKLIETYKKYHRPEGVWPAILASIKQAGIENLDIYLVGNRLFMIMDVDDSFSFEKKNITKESRILHREQPHLLPCTGLKNNLADTCLIFQQTI